MNNKNNVAKDYERVTRIANRRKELGLTQDELAYQIGIGRQALSAIENGGDFRITVLENMTKVLRISSDELLYGDTVNGRNNILSDLMIEISDLDDIEINKWLLMVRAVKKCGL